MNVEHIIDMARQVGASDVHLVCGLPVKFRLAGCLENAGVDGDAPLSHDECEQLARRLRWRRWACRLRSWTSRASSAASWW